MSHGKAENNLKKPVIILSKDAEIDAPSKDDNEIHSFPDHRNLACRNF